MKGWYYVFWLGIFNAKYGRRMNERGTSRCLSSYKIWRVITRPLPLSLYSSILARFTDIAVPKKNLHWTRSTMILRPDLVSLLSPRPMAFSAKSLLPHSNVACIGQRPKQKGTIAILREKEGSVTSWATKDNSEHIESSMFWSRVFG